MKALLKDNRIVPVCTIARLEDACPLAEALMRGGINVIEVTLRTEAGFASLEAIKKAFPEMLVGAGSIISPDTIGRLTDIGCDFGISPGIHPEIVGAAQRENFAYIPGVATSSEVMQALSLGVSSLKFFPAETNGGVKALKAIHAPFGATTLEWVPTGGISMAQLSDYLSLPQVSAIGGSWMVKSQWIEEKEFGEIERASREAVEAARLL